MNRGRAIRDAVYVVEMEDGTRWGVAVSLIALSRAVFYASDFGGNTARSLEEDTWPLFEEDDRAVEEWASNNMNWEDVVAEARLVHDDKQVPDYQEGWVNGEHTIRDPEACPGWTQEEPG